MHLIKKIFTIVFFSMSIYSQDYYGRMVDLGKVSEAGTDIIIYFEENTVRAYLRNYTNQFGNRYFHLFGRGSANDNSLELHSIGWEEGKNADGGVFKINFEKNKLICDRLPFVLLKDDKESKKYMGAPIKKENILIDASYFDENNMRELKLSIDESFVGEVSKFYQMKNKNNRNMKGEDLKKTPVDEAVYLFNKKIPLNANKNKLEGNAIISPKLVNDTIYNGYTYKTCSENFNIEEDYEGKCKTFHFYQKTNQATDVVLVEVEIHSTCLDDSCYHEYHQLRFLKHSNVGWQLLSHKSGLQCDKLRGGGSPPCL